MKNKKVSNILLYTLLTGKFHNESQNDTKVYTGKFHNESQNDTKVYTGNFNNASQKEKKFYNNNDNIKDAIEENKENNYHDKKKEILLTGNFHHTREVDNKNKNNDNKNINNYNKKQDYPTNNNNEDLSLNIKPKVKKNIKDKETKVDFYILFSYSSELTSPLCNSKTYFKSENKNDNRTTKSSFYIFNVFPANKIRSVDHQACVDYIEELKIPKNNLHGIRHECLNKMSLKYYNLKYSELKSEEERKKIENDTDKIIIDKMKAEEHNQTYAKYIWNMLGFGQFFKYFGYQIGKEGNIATVATDHKEIFITNKLKEIKEPLKNEPKVPEGTVTFFTNVNNPGLIGVKIICYQVPTTNREWIDFFNLDNTIINTDVIIFMNYTTKNDDICGIEGYINPSKNNDKIITNTIISAFYNNLIIGLQGSYDNETFQDCFFIISTTFTLINQKTSKKKISFTLNGMYNLNCPENTKKEYEKYETYYNKYKNITDKTIYEEYKKSNNFSLDEYFTYTKNMYDPCYLQKITNYSLSFSLKFEFMIGNVEYVITITLPIIYCCENGIIDSWSLNPFNRESKNTNNVLRLSYDTKVLLSKLFPQINLFNNNNNNPMMMAL